MQAQNYFKSFFLPNSPQCERASYIKKILDHTQRRTAVVRTHLVEWSAICRDLYLTTHNNHNRQTSMPQLGFEPTISGGETPQTARVTGVGEV